jgi:capsular polysaccharide biosynthesis protein
MRFMDSLMIVVRRWWLIALVVIIAAGSAYVISRSQPDVYRSTQLILIQPSRSDFGLTEASRLLLEPAVVYLNSTLRAQEIIDALELPFTAQDLKDRTTIASDNLRMVIQVDVDMPDASLGSRVAKAWGDALVEYRRQLNQIAEQADRVVAVLPDVPQSRQIAPQPLISGIAGAVLGLLLGIVLAFVLEFLESGVIRRRDDLERSARISVLASIPDR